jgi:hypothetical protein
MRRALAIAMFGLALAGAACPKRADVSDPPRRSTELPRPRDGDVAVREELDAARRAGTVEAYDLFIARYPRHPLAQVARRERGALTDPASKPRG